MKEQLIETLDYILQSDTSIKHHIDKIAEIRESLIPLLTDIEQLELSYKIKNRVQREANEGLDKLGGTGAIFGATGIGKSKIVIDRIVRQVGTTSIGAYKEKEHYIVVPTVKLRDTTWKEEFEKWNYSDIYKNYIRTICYDSLHTLVGLKNITVYLDEGHNITEAHVSFFEVNKIDHIILLTATKPRSDAKKEILRKLCPYIAFELDTDEAVKLGIIAPYEITVVTAPLNNKDLTIKAGNKTKSWMQTEAAAYEYATSKIKSVKGTPFDLIRRRTLLSNLKSKLDAAQKVLDLIPINLRTLIFCGSIEQAITVCPYRYYSRPSISKKDKPETIAKKERLIENWPGNSDLIAFKAEVCTRMSCVEALNEGENIENLDLAVMVQIDSNPQNFIQRMGRNLRFRPGHIGKIIIIGADGTEDMRWISKATFGLVKDNIRYITLADILEGKQQLFIN